MTNRTCVFALAGALLCLPAGGQEFKVPEKLDLRLPMQQGSVRFAVIGDMGNGERRQYEVGQMMAAFHGIFPFNFVITNGDNLYGRQRPKDFEKKFEKPYEALLKAGVKFYASLGNHDELSQISYKPFNMGGERYYTFRPKEGVTFFALDSNNMDSKQVQWLERELGKASEGWRIAYFHHPLYSSGRTHGSSLDLRSILEPIFVKFRVQVVFAGHDHFYERIKPQAGVQHFVEGSSGQLRVGNITKNDQTALGYDEDNTFMLVEIVAEEMYFQTVSRTGQIVDSGSIARMQVGQ